MNLMGMHPTTPPNNNVLILLAPGFEAGPMVYCLEHMRDAGIPVSLIGLASGVIPSVHGLAIRPDCSLNQIMPEDSPRLVIVPGGAQSISSLIADPRVHRMFDAALANGGFVATMSGADSILEKAGIFSPSQRTRFLSQGNLKISKFSSHLINLISD